MDALLRARMQPLEVRLDKLQTSLPTATDFGVLLASLDALTTALWAVYDRDGTDDNRAPTAAGLSASWDEDEVQRPGRGKGQGRVTAVEGGDLLIE